MTGRPAYDDLDGGARLAPLPPVADLYAWAKEQAAHIRAGRFDQADIAGIADEIKTVGRSGYSARVNNLAILILRAMRSRVPVHRLKQTFRALLFPLNAHMTGWPSWTGLLYSTLNRDHRA